MSKSEAGLPWGKVEMVVYELAMEKAHASEEAIAPIHCQATMIDDRYLTTEQEKSNLESSIRKPVSLKTEAVSSERKEKNYRLSRRLPGILAQIKMAAAC
jgi:hypothetical protein